MRNELALIRPDEAGDEPAGCVGRETVVAAVVAVDGQVVRAAQPGSAMASVVSRRS